jgi:hypothetical protein
MAVSCNIPDNSLWGGHFREFCLLSTLRENYRVVSGISLTLTKKLPVFRRKQIEKITQNTERSGASLIHLKVRIFHPSVPWSVTRPEVDVTCSNGRVSEMQRNEAKRGGGLKLEYFE